MRGSLCVRYFTGKSVKEKKSYNTPLAVWSVRKDGTVQQRWMSKSEVLEAFPSVLARDLRTVDDSRRMISEVLVREQALVLKLEHIRVVVDRDKAVVFDGAEPVVASFAQKLGTELADTVKRDAFPGMMDFKEEMELNTLECVLAATSENFELRFSLLDTIARQLLRSVNTSSYDESIMRLMPVKRAIALLHTALVEHKNALHTVISDPLVLRGLCLHRDSAGQDPARDQEIQLAVEAAEVTLLDYQRRSEELLNELEDLQEGVASVETASNQALSATRNSLMRLNLQISFASLGVSTMAALFSAFGMNLFTGLEQAPTAFQWVIVGGCLGSAAVWTTGTLIYGLMRRRSMALQSVISPSVDMFSKVTTAKFVHNLFAHNHTSERHTRALLETALGRTLTDEQFAQIKEHANTNKDSVLDCTEALRYVRDLSEQGGGDAINLKGTKD